RIQNGTITPPDLFQFAVQIRSGSLCTASIISNRHLLTAAHCINEGKSMKKMHNRYKVYSEMPYYAILRPISESVQNKSLLPKSTTVYLPKEYSKKHVSMDDIAIIEFPEDTFYGIEPVKLAKDYIEKEGDEAFIIGFGAWWMEGEVDFL
uniref:Peptidase S1 domain-containing protein n=1 Tax=Panagrolaimus sp. ES5 TaxID=591445 RepID=A0AC34GDM9_9BILA